MPPHDFGFNYPEDYLRFNFDVWIRSEFKTWPNGLGYDDQDPLLVDDFGVLLTDLDYQLSFLKDTKSTPGEEKPEDTPNTLDFKDL